MNCVIRLLIALLHVCLISFLFNSGFSSARQSHCYPRHFDPADSWWARNGKEDEWWRNKLGKVIEVAFLPIFMLKTLDPLNLHGGNAVSLGALWLLQPDTVGCGRGAARRSAHRSCFSQALLLSWQCEHWNCSSVRFGPNFRPLRALLLAALKQLQEPGAVPLHTDRQFILAVSC